MRRNKILSIFLALIFTTSLLSFISIPSHELLVFYDGTAQQGDSVYTTLNTIKEICEESIDVRFVSIDDASDLRGMRSGRHGLMMVFHGSDRGPVLSKDGKNQHLMTWSQLGDFIDSSSYSEYYVLACDSSNVDRETSKERVLTFSGQVDSKVAAIIAALKFQDVLRLSSPRAARIIFEKTVHEIEESDFLYRYFMPEDPLDAWEIDRTTQHRILAQAMKDCMNAVRYQTNLIAKEQGNIYKISKLLTQVLDMAFFGWFSLLKDFGGAVTEFHEALMDVINDVISGDVTPSTIKTALKKAIELWDIGWILQNIVFHTEKARHILNFVHATTFATQSLITIYTLKAETEDPDRSVGSSGTMADALAIAMDDDLVRKYVVAGALPQSESIYNGLEDLVAALEGPFDYDVIRNSAKAVRERCKTALSSFISIGGDNQHYTKAMLEGIRDAADCIYQSGAYYLDRYAMDNYYYDLTWSVGADFLAARLKIAYDFYNPPSNQIPIYKIWNKFEETRHGDWRQRHKTFYYYLLPGEHYGETFKLKYDGWKGWKVVFSWSITWKQNVDLYGTYKSGTDTDGDGLSDYDELWLVYGYRTCPTLWDTDGDGYGDKWEIDHGYSPLDARSRPPPPPVPPGGGPRPLPIM